MSTPDRQRLGLRCEDPRLQLAQQVSGIESIEPKRTRGWDVEAVDEPITPLSIKLKDVETRTIDATRQADSLLETVTLPSRLPGDKSTITKEAHGWSVIARLLLTISDLVAVLSSEEFEKVLASAEGEMPGTEMQLLLERLARRHPLDCIKLYNAYSSLSQQEEHRLEQTRAALELRGTSCEGPVHLAKLKVMVEQCASSIQSARTRQAEYRALAYNLGVKTHEALRTVLTESFDRDGTSNDDESGKDEVVAQRADLQSKMLLLQKNNWAGWDC